MKPGGRIAIGAVLLFTPLALSFVVYPQRSKGSGSENTAPQLVVPQLVVPHKAEPHKAEPYKTEPHEAEPYKTEPHEAEPHKAEPHDADWLRALDQSPATPPPYVFGVAWTLLYLLIGAAAAVFVDAWVSSPSSPSSHTPSSLAFFVLGLVLFCAQLAANYAYLRVFFVGHDIRRSLYILCGTLAAAAAACLVMAPVSPLAAALMCPYVGYLVFALHLHLYLDANNVTVERSDTMNVVPGHAFAKVGLVSSSGT